MKILFAFLLVGLLSPTATLPAEIGPPVQLLTVDVRLQIVRRGDFATKKQEYVEQATSDLREMQQTLYPPAEAGGSAGRSATGADRELYTAWNNLKTAAWRLQSAGEDNWARATSSYELAIARFRGARDGVRVTGE